VKMLVPSLTLLLLVTGEAQAIKITGFIDIDTFVSRAKDIVIAKCLGPVPDGRSFDDGFYPVDVQVVSVIKGAKKLGKAKIATIYPMEAGKTYLLTSLGGSAFGTDLLAVPELSVVELPPSFRLDDLEGKRVSEQVQALFAARRQENERQQRLLKVEMKLLDKAVSKKKATGILILDDCDVQYQDKIDYKDNLTLLDSTGEMTFRVSGFNNCESIGSTRMIAADPQRKCVWVIENVAHRIRRFDLAGKETLIIPGVHGSAIAVDPETGNVWALAGGGQIGNGKTVVYDVTGKEVATHDISGWDIAYDRKAKAFWIAEMKLTKISAVKGVVLFSTNISTWCASSLDVDPRSGAAWVTVRAHPEVAGSSNRLLKFDADGKEVVAIDLGPKSPFRVSVDPKDGSVWVAHLNRSVERFSANGKSETEHPVAALAVQVDPARGDAWVVTPTEVQKMTRKGEVTKRVSHAGKTSQAWIAALE
jgi:hypothetical protein